jgi:hypothetical protein
MSLKVEVGRELNIAFTTVTHISAKRHFWKYELRSWFLRLGLVFKAEEQSFKVEDDLTRECSRGE